MKKNSVRACRRCDIRIDADTATRPRRTLLQSHLRQAGEHVPQPCIICLVELRVDGEQLRPLWQQCPTCKTVLHEKCLLTYMKEYEDEFLCPSCRTSYRFDAIEHEDAWNADDVIDALLDSDEDYEDGTRFESVLPTRRSNRTVRSATANK